MIKMKAVVPAQYKSDAFRVEFIKSMKEFIDGPVDKDFRATVATWKDKPTFEKTVGVGGDGVTGKEETDHQKYIWVSEGTEDHMVPKSGVATMAFRPGYHPKTRVRTIGSTTGGAFGDVIVRTGAWMVSGIEARKFDETIARERAPDLIKYGNEAIERGRRNCGHAI